MHEVVLSSTAFIHGSDLVTNDELVESFNAYAAQNPETVKPSSSEFIEKASGIRQRYVIDKAGVLDVERMRPKVRERSIDEPSLQAEFCLEPARRALEAAKLKAEDVDLVIVACSNLQRAYPAVAIEVQSLLGTSGSGYDMNVACGSATFASHNAIQSVRTGAARAALVLSPEITSGHLNWRDRDTHFIFGDGCTAIVFQRKDDCQVDGAFKVVSSKAETKLSNNLRNNFGYLNTAEDADPNSQDKLFVQRGRSVFKEVVPLAAAHMKSHWETVGSPEVARLWLHQANQSMNELIAKMFLGRPATPEEAPIVLDRYANIAACGSVIAFHETKEQLKSGEWGIICSFGAGYSVGSLIVQKA
jgi:beta-ketodecanoyl-[acyl-carrier-protein] synthase